MTTSEALTLGWHHATTAAAYLLGALLPALLLVALIAAGYHAAELADRHNRIARIKRQTRHSGRT